MSIVFGQVRPSVAQVFFTSALSHGLVNLKPVLPGHVLVIPKRRALRYADLTEDEIGSVLERHYGASSLTFAMQDGKEAGQTIFHVHVHVIPRREGDFERNDDVYRKLEEERPPRTDEVMATEAAQLRAYFAMGGGAPATM